jgi:tetratricopeptide (TPR) repeat protein
VVETTPGGGRRFVPLPLPPTTRVQAVEALMSLRHLGPSGAERALAEVQERNPRSVHARCYMGELYLWLGRYPEAMREFVLARCIAPARWADIGMLAVLIFRGHLRLARFAASYAERHHPFIPGGTLPVYRGVLRRRLGDLDGAITDFDASLEAKPSRIGARMELVLALRAAGRRAEVVPHAEILLRDATPVLLDAARALGYAGAPDSNREILVQDEVFEEALRSMRGNRSSSLVSWFDDGGRVKVLGASSASHTGCSSPVPHISAYPARTP